MHYSVVDINIMAQAVEQSKMFRAGKEKKPLSLSQVMTLMLISNAEGRHPALGPKDYDIIDGKPAKKTDSMLRDFLLAGGKVEWHVLSDTAASATFSHPQGGTIKIDWDVERAKKAGLIGKDMWQKWRRQMFRARTISEGIRTVFPAATSGFYNTEEMADMSNNAQPQIVENTAVSIDVLTDQLAADVAVSEDLEATYLANADTFARMELERPDWVPLMQALFEKRQEELSTKNLGENHGKIDQ